MKKIIVANWKMNPSSSKEAQKIFGDIKKTASQLKNVETIICPPFVYLSDIGSSVSNKNKNFRLGAQDLFWENPPAGGSYTGEVSSKMLRNIGANYVIIGHSERREHLQETNEIINKKIKTALKDNLKVIFCVGEKERSDNYLQFIKEEILEGLQGIQRNFLKNLIIAYEPIWAIGKKGKDADTPENVMQMSIYIKRVFLQVAGKDMARKISVLYGGSVDPENAGAFLNDGGVQGLLVGHESLMPKNFGAILRVAEISAKKK